MKECGFPFKLQNTVRAHCAPHTSFEYSVVSLCCLVFVGIQAPVALWVFDLGNETFSGRHIAFDACKRVRTIHYSDSPNWHAAVSLRDPATVQTDNSLAIVSAPQSRTLIIVTSERYSLFIGASDFRINYAETPRRGGVPMASCNRPGCYPD